MLSFIIIVIGLAGLIGLAIMYSLPKLSMTTFNEIDWKEYGATLAVMSLVISPGLYWMGDKLSVNEQLVYQEFYNGVETDAKEYVRECRAGQAGNSYSSGKSNCHYVYVCGRYSFEETYFVSVSYIDANGKSQTRMETRIRTVSADIECPFLTHEFTYVLYDSLPDGERDLPGVYADENPIAWNPGVAIPPYIPFGPPAEWMESRRRIDVGDPRPVTRMYPYDNFILAAKEDLLLPYVEDIQRYLDAGILPEHTRNIHDDPVYGYSDSIADKLSFVGMEPPGNEAEWQEALNGLNGVLGMTLRGDVHMVIIDANLVESKVQYVQALKAYWSSDAFGRRAIAKNAIIIAIGILGDTVEWAEATTGMPYGNEVMVEAISTRFEGTDVPFTHQAIIGNPRLQILKDETGDDEQELQLAEPPGVIEEVILKDFPFARASMECKDEDDGESCLGFGHLVSKLEPTIGTKIVMGAVALFISLIFWVFAVYFDCFAWCKLNSVSSSHIPTRSRF